MNFKNIFIIAFFLFSLNIMNNAYSQTIEAAMAEAYRTNSKLLAARANSRAEDEDVSIALSGWKPKISVEADIGKDIITTETSVTDKTANNTPLSLKLSLSQQLYDGGKVEAQIKSAESMALASYAEISNVEHSVLLSAAESYLNVILNYSILNLAIKNEKIISRHLQASKDRFEVGEVTRTDVAQAEARLADAKASTMSSRGDLDIAIASYIEAVGSEPNRAIRFPEELPQLPSSLSEALNIGRTESPNLIIALHKERSALHDISEEAASLMPEITLDASGSHSWDPNTFFDKSEVYKIGAKFKIPLYQRGAEYASIRKKRQIAVQKRRERENLYRNITKEIRSSWNSLESAKVQIMAFNSSVKANKIALDGVRQESSVGSRTTLDVLDAEKELFLARNNLIKARRNLYVAAYRLVKVIGRLEARRLGLKVKLYDPNIHYNEVIKLWKGITNTSDTYPYIQN